MPETRDEDFEELLRYLKVSRGFDFTGYKRSTLIRRVRKRAQEVGRESFSEYHDLLQVDPNELAHLFDNVLINVTGFFRDREAWDFLRDEVIPKIADTESPQDLIRVWSAGCASGEEVCSVAMLLCEYLGLERFQERAKLYATDVDEEALTAARHGTYSAKAMESVPPEFQSRYFTPVASHFVFRPEIRRSIIYGRHDLVLDAPISRLDLLLCRNTLMYFDAETQARIVARLHYALKDERFLFLGRAEMLLRHGELFEPLAMKHRIFTKVTGRFPPNRIAAVLPGEELQPIAKYLRLRDAAVESAPVAQIVVDAEGLLVLANEQARALFTISPKDLGRPFQDLEVSYRPVELRSHIDRAYNERSPVMISGAERSYEDGGSAVLDIEVAPLLDSEGNPLGVSISFVDQSQYHHARQELDHTRQELETTTEELQSTNEELETTNEELQSTVEELETTNEELQSSNEELETMNEELHSTNSELQATNDEMQKRTQELNRLNAFSTSVMTSIKMGVAVLDRSARIQAWNPGAQDLWGVRAEEVVGTSFFDVDIGLPVRNLKALIEECLNDHATSREVVLDAVNRRGQKIECRVTGSSLLGPQLQIHGVVVLMVGAPRPDSAD